MPKVEIQQEFVHYIGMAIDFLTEQELIKVFEQHQKAQSQEIGQIIDKITATQLAPDETVKKIINDEFIECMIKDVQKLMSYLTSLTSEVRFGSFSVSNVNRILQFRIDDYTGKIQALEQAQLQMSQKLALELSESDLELRVGPPSRLQVPASNRRNTLKRGSPASTRSTQITIEDQLPQARNGSLLLQEIIAKLQEKLQHSESSESLSVQAEQKHREPIEQSQKLLAVTLDQNKTGGLFLGDVQILSSCEGTTVSVTPQDFKKQLKFTLHTPPIAENPKAPSAQPSDQEPPTKKQALQAPPPADPPPPSTDSAPKP